MKKDLTGIVLFFLFVFITNGCDQFRKGKEFHTADAAFEYYTNQLLEAKYEGNSRSMANLWHPIQWEVLRVMHPEKSNDSEILQYIHEKINTESLKQTNQELNMKFDFQRILNRMEHKNHKIYVANYVFSGERNLDKVWYNYFIIGFCDTANFNWKFIEFDEEFIDPIIEKIIDLTSDNIGSEIITTVSQIIVYDDKIKAYKPKDHLEQNMMKDFQKYFASFTGGNLDRVFQYLHPKILKYIVENSPSLSMDQAKDIFKEQYAMLAEKINTENLKVQIDDIIHKEIYRNSIIIKLKYSLVNEQDNIYQSIGSKLIAFSNDNGYSWFFVEYDPDMIYIMLSDYPQELIQKFITE
jgi:hypothetical protein